MAPQPRFDELLDAIEADSAPEAARRRGTPLAIAASVVALIGAALFVLLDRLPPPSAPQIFETATTPAAAAAIDYIFEVEFAVDAQSGLRAQFVESLGATNLGPGDRPGSFRIAAAAPVTTAADLSEFIDSMSQYEGVRSVRFVAVQLPAQ